MLPDTYCEYKKRTASTDKLFNRSMSVLRKVYSLIPDAVSAPMYSWGEAERLGWNLPDRRGKKFLRGRC